MFFLFNCVDILLLISFGGIKQCEVSCEWSHSVLEVLQIKNEVWEYWKFWVVFSLLDHHVVLGVGVIYGVILENFAKADLISVVQIVEVLEESLFFTVSLIVIFVLFKSFFDNVFSHWFGFLCSRISELAWIQHELCNWVVLYVLSENFPKILLKSRVSSSCSFSESL